MRLSPGGGARRSGARAHAPMTGLWPTVVMTWWASLGSATADLALGRCCAGCDRPGMFLCPECRHELVPRVRFHTRLHLDEIAPGVGLSIFVPLDYSGVRRHVLYRFKDHGDFSVAPTLIRALSAVLTETLGVLDVTPAAAVPIPMRRAAARRRGFSPVLHLLEGALPRTNPSLRIESLLADDRTGRGDKGLGSADRRAAVAGAFRVRGRNPGVPVLLVDDVVTTGSTMREAAITLMHSGVQVVAGVAVAGTQFG